MTLGEVLNKSKNIDIQKIWKCLCGDEKEQEEKTKPNPKEKFLGYKFIQQMKSLYKELDSCSCHFVRCIKPNPDKQKGYLKPVMTLEQIKYMGILDTIRVRRDSYPVRRLYKFFYQRYEELHGKASMKMFEQHEAEGADFKQLTIEICKQSVPHLGTNKILVGITRIFMRLDAVAELERLRTIKLRKKVECAKKFRNAYLKVVKLRQFRTMLKGVKTVQRLFRVRKEYQKFQKMRKCAKKIQKWWRYKLFKWWLIRARKAAIKIQAWWRSVYYKQRYHKMIENARFIARVWRGAIVRRKLMRLRHAKQILEEIIDRASRKLFERV
jgi:myosin-5